jgi:hypothetical protein
LKGRTERAQWRAATHGGLDPIRSAQYWWTTIGASEDERHARFMDRFTPLQYMHRDGRTFQRLVRSDRYRNRRVARLANRADARALTMVLMSGLSCIAPVQ